MEGRRTGLFFGKFNPFHKGHEYVIWKALAEVDKLYILVSDHPGTGHTVQQRCEWIRYICDDPRVVVKPVYNAPTPDMKIYQHNWVKKFAIGRPKIDVVFNNEWYGRPTAIFFRAELRRIDPDRKSYPITATKIREDPRLYSRFLHPIVRRDVVGHIDTGIVH